MDPRLVTEIREYLHARMKKNQIPAIAYAIMRGDEVVVTEGLGIANLEWNNPAGIDTAFQLASATKPIAGTLVMMCVESGELRLDAPVTEYLPDTPQSWSGITVRHLATHSSGLPDDVSHRMLRLDATGTGASDEGSTSEVSIADVVTAAAQLPLEYEPGSTSRYALTDFVVLTAILETVTGTPIQQLLRDRLLDPLGMRATCYDNTVNHGEALRMDIVPRRAGVYRVMDGRLREIKFRYPRWGYIAGGLYSSVQDITTWLAALYRGELLTPASMAEMWRPQTLNDGTPGLFSPGWVVYTHRGRPVTGHSGGPALADIERFPLDDLTVVVLCNQQSIMPDIAPTVADMVHIRSTYEEARAVLGSTTGRGELAVAPEPLDSYAGSFDHPDSGVLSIGRNDDELTLTYRGETFPLRYFRVDVFEWRPGEEAEPIPVTFTTGVAGGIAEWWSRSILRGHRSSFAVQRTGQCGIATSWSALPDATTSWARYSP